MTSTDIVAEGVPGARVEACVDTCKGEPLDPRAFRNALGRFPTGVTVVTATAEDGEKLGMTMSSFNTLSLDPPLVLFSIGKTAFGLPKWRDAEGYAIHVLTEDQIDLSNRFAKPATDKWDAVETDLGTTGAPSIDGAAAAFECRPHKSVDAGDHVLFIAEVVQHRESEATRPLVFWGGRYNKLDNET